MTALRLAVTLYFLLSGSQLSVAAVCSDLVLEKFGNENEVMHRGYYFHPDHCFSVVIPPGVVGRTSSQPSSQHGFGAVLSKKGGGAYLLVQGDSGAWLDDPDDPRSIEKVVRVHSGWLREEGATIVKTQFHETRLGQLAAGRLVLTYKCRGSDRTTVFDSIFALEPQGALYELNLWAGEPAYESVRSILEKVAASWKLERHKCKRLLNERLRKGASPNKAATGEGRHGGSR